MKEKWKTMRRIQHIRQKLMSCINCGTYSTEFSIYDSGHCCDECQELVTLFNEYGDWFDSQQEQNALPTDATPQRVLFCEDEILNREQRQWLDDWLDRWIVMWESSIGSRRRSLLMDKCHGCGCYGEVLHVDRYHRLTPLCSECYYDPAIAKRTASNPDDPSCWWNKSEYLE
jgi:hypothetical protein